MENSSVILDNNK